MFDPDDYELHEAQKHACKMAKERDEARVMADKLTAELAACAAALPGVYYMDPPDGGDVPVSEQLRRMAKDAERYRYLRDIMLGYGRFAEKNFVPEAEKAKPKSAWTRTADGMPPDEAPVLIKLNGVVRIGAIFWEHPGHEDTFKAYRYWDDPENDGQDWAWDDVTEWAPIPT